MTDIELLPAARHARMRWANGGGWTTEIVAEPSSGRWEWRLSVADVDAGGPFSVFPGVDRTIAMLSGNGFALTVGEGVERIIDAPFLPFDFAGDEVTTCRLLDGPVHDINLMVRRGSPPRRLAFTHIAPSSGVDLLGVEVVVVVAGAARVDAVDLGYLDAIRITAPVRALGVTAAAAGAVVASVTATTHG